MAKTKTLIYLGYCPECKEKVKTRDTFDIHLKTWGMDFPGDKPGSVVVYTHRACNTRANHSKD